VETARTIRVTIDNSDAKRGAAELRNELKSLSGQASSTARGQSDLTRAANDNTRAFNQTARAANESGRAMNTLNTAIKGFVALGTAKVIIGLADSFTRFTNSLRVAGVEGDNQRLVIDKLFASAQKYGVQLEAMSALYGKASQAQKSLNASQGDLLKFSNGVAAALKVQGGTVESAAGALHQLGQAITGNKIQAEEYNSILDGAYPILQAVAAGSDKYKGSVAALTKEVKAGNVTSKQFFEDFLKGSASLEERAAKSNFTVAASWQVLTNAVTKYLGEADQANVVSGTLGGAIRGLGDNLGTIVPIVTSLGLALGVGFVARAVAASVAATGAATTMGAMAVAARGAGAALMGAFGGPIGMAITGVSLLLVGLFNDSQSATAAFEANAIAADKFGVKLSDVSKAAASASTETRGVGTGAAGAEPAIWSFANASGNLTKQLWEQAKAARAARVELLGKQLADANGRIATGQDATWEGSRRNSRASWDALKQGDVMEGVSLGWKSVKSDARYALSGGRTDREGRALVADSGKVAGAIQKQIDALNNSPIGKSDLPGGGGAVASPAGGKKDGGGKSSAATEAERKAKAQAEFWKGLEKEVELSAVTTQQAEVRRKEMEIEALTGKKIADIDAERVKAGQKTVANLVQQNDINAYVAQANEQHRLKMLDLTDEQTLLDLKRNGATEEQIAIEKTALDFANSVKKANLAIDEATLKTLTDQVREEAKRSGEIAKQNKLMADGEAAALKYSTSYAASQQAKVFADERAGLVAKYNGGQNAGFSKEQFDKAIKGLDQAIGDAALESSHRMADLWGQTIEDLGYQIGGTFGKAFSKVGKMVQQLVAGAQGNLGQAGIFGQVASLFGKDATDGFKEASQGLLNGFGDIFGKDTGIFAKSLGKTLGKLGAGSQLGGMAGSALSMLGVKGSKTGASIGGALGALTPFGPLGSIVGGALGSVLGGMLKKTKYGTASISQLAGGELGVGSLKGNSTSRKDNASGAAGSVISGLQSIAAELGATLTGSPSVSIGMYKKDWRVSDTGRTGKLKGKYSDVTDFGDDAEAAIAYAIQVALQDGILTGISEFSKMVISANGDEKALSLAKSYESILDSLAKFNNPIKGAVDEAVKDIDTLTEQMKAAGASAADLANVEQYRSIKLKEILDDQLSGFKDTMEQLNGSASGKSPFALLQEDMKELDAFRSTIASGGSVDSNEFNSLVQTIMGELGDVYGSNTKQYQDIFADLKTLTEAAMGNVTTEFNKASGAEGTTAAVETQTAAIETQTQAINTSNQYLEIIAKALTGSRQITQTLTGQNGVLLNAN
tara:strand:+ start:5084 stop:9007 length:3924 start_codon:yes stop_codon:yes gene_type:complete